MRVAICPGSFDPVTLGHMDIITRSTKLFARVIVAVMTNVHKSPMFTTEERLDFLRRATAHLPHVEVVAYDGLLADFCREQHAAAIVKGLRAMSDFEYEFQMALTNRRLNDETETVFLTTSADKMYLSSSLVKQIASYGGDISEFVPREIVEDITRRTERTAP